MNSAGWRGADTHTVHILGRGVSGRAAAALATAEGMNVRMFDESGGADPFEQKENAADRNPLWIVSPGFSQSHPWCRRIQQEGQVNLPELEFGASFLEGELLVVTGSLGKTSMVLLAADLLKRAGISVTVSGNIGKPVSETALENRRADVHILEASSFQLESLVSLHPHRAVCLNLFPNHLDRHHTLEDYARAKARLFLNMTDDDYATWPDSYPVQVKSGAQPQRADPGNLPPLEGTVFEHGPLRQNLAMLTSVIRDLSGVDDRLLETCVREFRFPDHRMQEVTIPGMGRVMDDSKSTCFSATRAALQRLPGRVHLLMGGQDKGQDPSELTEVLRQRNPALYLFGTSGKKMQKLWKDSVDVCVFEDSLSDVMQYLFTFRTTSQEPVLFSPGCASFDQFKGFADRGRTFQNLFARYALEHPFT